jgi:uncharacterized peroxidase-related enzyme
MSRLSIPELQNTLPAAQPLLAAVEKQLGIVPNLFRLIAHSPATLQGYLGFNAGLAKALDVRTRERIALAIAQLNGCDYCLSAHTYLGLNLAKIDEAEIALNRQGASADPKASAAVGFAVKVAQAGGKVADADLAGVRAAGFSEAQVVEIVALVAENVFTNYLNNVAATPIDFPLVLAADAP